MGATVTRDAREPHPADEAAEMSGWKRRWQEIQLSLRLLIRSPLAATGLAIVLIYVAITVYVLLFVPNNDTMEGLVSQTYFPPPLGPWWWPGGSAAGGWFGQTGYNLGIPMDQAIPMAIKTDLLAAGFVVLSGAAVGSLVGVYSAYKGGLFDEALMRVTDVTYSIPFIVLAIAIAFAFNKRDFLTLNEVLLVLWWPPYARLVRSQALSVKELRFVEAARAAGASDARIMIRHVLPNTLAPVFVQISLDLGSVTQVFAALDFIGFAQQNPLIPELGNLITIGFRDYLLYPWMVIIPGVVLLIFTVGVNLLGDGLRDVLDPRVRR